ncbi:HIRAN domain-containing protein [Thiobacter aerophilum]|uniref:HIRAN domain-containing protein n=1 Tax=Thiobacter aerophilum TaxID=3121275 RepID=A0ABV0EEM6_9BURK
MLRLVLAAAWAALVAPTLAAEVQARMVLATLPLAGFQYHAGRQVWNQLRVGDVLTLEREPDNPHDPRAVRVSWRGEMLGYVPRAGNETVARLLDQGVRLSGRITHLQPGRSHWARVQFEVVIEP